MFPLRLTGVLCCGQAAADAAEGRDAMVTPESPVLSRSRRDTVVIVRPEFTQELRIRKRILARRQESAARRGTSTPRCRNAKASGAILRRRPCTPLRATALRYLSSSLPGAKATPRNTSPAFAERRVTNLP